MEYQYTEPGSPSSHQRRHEETTCCTCGTAIAERDRRLTWRIRDGDDVFRYEYCSDECLPATAPETP